MKQYWLLNVENDEAIVRNGCEKEDFENLKEANLHFMIQCFFFFFLFFFFFFLSFFFFFFFDEFLMNLALLFIMERRRMVDM